MHLINRSQRQSFLAVEVVVQASMAHTGSIAHHGGAGRREPTLREQLARGTDQLLPRAVRGSAGLALLRGHPRLRSTVPSSIQRSMVHDLQEA